MGKRRKEDREKQIKRRQRSRIISEPAEKYDDICSELLLGTQVTSIAGRFMHGTWKKERKT